MAQLEPRANVNSRVPGYGQCCQTVWFLLEALSVGKLPIHLWEISDFILIYESNFAASECFIKTEVGT